MLNYEGDRKNMKKNSSIKFENSDFYNENDYSYPGQFYNRYGCIIENFLKIEAKYINFQKKFSTSQSIILCVYSKFYYEELSKSKKIKL